MYYNIMWGVYYVVPGACTPEGVNVKRRFLFFFLTCGLTSISLVNVLPEEDIHLEMNRSVCFHPTRSSFLKHVVPRVSSSLYYGL